jgi:Flp pilus assembly protein TadD
MYDIELGRMDVALKEHEELHASYPNDPAVLNNLAWLLQSKDKTRALELAERAHKLAPTSPAIADTLGWLLVERGDNARAVTLLKDAAANSANQPQIRYHYAVALKNTGQRDEARRILEELTASNVTFDNIADARKLLDDLKRN